SEFHVTLIHRASASQHPQLWQQLSDLHTSLTRKANSDPSRKNSAAANDDASAPPPSPDPDLGTVKVLLERLIWDERLMCIVVRLLSSRAADGSAADFASVNEVPHVTVGTANATVKPKESNDLLNKWLAHGSGADTGLRELPVRGHVELEGRVKGVLQRR
ncbi:tRNA ligase, partial [Cryomyces antarcticus]